MKKLLMGLLALGTLSSFAAQECKRIELDTVAEIQYQHRKDLKNIFQKKQFIKEKRAFEICADISINNNETHISKLNINNSLIKIAGYKPEETASKICSLFSNNSFTQLEITTQNSNGKALQIVGKKAGRFYERKEKGFNTYTSIIKRKLRVIKNIVCKLPY
ncbi:MAG: hypothetical protein N4A33_01785 [Bacteriovoracaceae bacterium]|jgi:hypothetical protein|nr:hypothetical protein [Bacteriovoracaceae bacterium]